MQIGASLRELVVSGGARLLPSRRPVDLVLAREDARPTDRFTAGVQIRKEQGAS